MPHDPRKYLDDGIKVTKTTVEFGPLKIYRVSSIPANSFGRNGDIAIVDDTAIPLEGIASDVVPTTTDLCQKVGGVWVCGLGGGGGPGGPNYGRITGGDGGTAIASLSGDEITVNGTGINVIAVNAASPLDTLSLVMDISDLPVTGGNLSLGDEIGANDGGNTFRFTFSDVVNDLDIPFGITSNGVVTRTGSDTYTSRIISVNAVGNLDGLVISDGDGVAGNPTIGLDIRTLPARSDAVDPSDRLAVWNSTSNANEYYTVGDLGIGGGGIPNAYSSITGGDGGTAVAVGSDLITVNGTGINVTATNAGAGADTISLVLDISDLTAGVGPIVLGDEIAVNDGGTTLRFGLTNLVNDLDIPNAIIVNGLVTRTAADTYASRSIAINGAGNLDGLAVSDGNGVAGNPTLGLDIQGLPARAAVDAVDRVPVWDSTANANVYYTISDITSAGGSSNSFSTWARTGNGSGGSLLATSATDTATFDGGIGIFITTTPVSDTISFAFSQSGMADTAITAADSIPFFDATNSNEPEFRIVSSLITDLGILTSANQVVFTSVTGDTGTGTADTNADSLALVGATSGGITTIASDDPEVVTFGITPTDLVTGSATLTTSDFIIVSDSTDGVTTLAQKYTFQDMIDDLGLATGGLANAYSNITGGDGGTAVAIGSDTITFNGEGINITATNAGAGADTVAFDLDISDLGAGTTVALTDEIAVDQAADPNVKFSFTKVVGDLDIPNAITVDGFVVRTAADTYASRTIVASTNEDELGATVTNGDGVAGNPTVGVDIVGQTDPNADMAATDEFLVHDKSEGTGGANRKMTGQNIADGVVGIVLTGLQILQITGADAATSEPMLFITDTTRTNKILSVEANEYVFGMEQVSDNDYVWPPNTQDNEAGYIAPYDGTVVRGTVYTVDNLAATTNYELVINAANQGTILTTAGAGAQSNEDTDLDINFSAGDRLRIQVDGGDAEDLTLSLWVKWRSV